MAIIRRKAAEKPKTVTGRIGELLLNRRKTIAEARVKRIDVQRRTGGQIAHLPEDINPLTDLVVASGGESRPPRQNEYLHVSDLISRCIRKMAIVEAHRMQRPSQRLSLMDLLTFAVGDTIHDVIKARATIGGPSRVWGNWSCKCGTSKTVTPCTLAETDETVRCPACKGPLNQYQEISVRDDELRIVGTPDLLLYLPDFDAIYITELKSISHEKWKEMVRPEPEHVIQVLFYWFILQRAGYRLADKVSIFYVTKGYVFGGVPHKEFVLEPAGMMKRLDSYLETAREMVEFRQTGQLPARTMCASDQAPIAKKCEVCSVCFGGSGNAPVAVSITKALRRR